MPAKLRSIVIKTVGIGVFFIVLFALYHLFFYIDKKRENTQVSENRKQIRLTNNQCLLLHEGDIILRRGYGYFSDFIASHLNNDTLDVTHAGILVRERNSWMVIHSLSSEASAIDGVQKQSLAEFLRFSQPGKIIVSRVHRCTLEQGKQIAQKALYYLQKKVPFDHKGNYEDASSMYCTEMIWHILETDLHLIHLPKHPQQRKELFYSMKGMYSATYFDRIISTYPHESTSLKVAKL